VDGVGDTDGDGLADILIGAGISGVDDAYLYEGTRAGGVETSVACTLSGIGGGSTAVTDAAGDVNGDGLADVVVGDAWYMSSGGGSHGRADVFLGFGDGDGDGYDALEDCDDTDPAVSPGATEVCDPDARDEDCDGLADDRDPSVTGRATYYEDRDGDGFGGPRSKEYCAPPHGWIAAGGDCDDDDDDIHPAAREVCDLLGTDEDCDGLVDDDDPSVEGGRTYYEDEDGDGFGSAARTFCEPPDDFVTQGGDCDDSDPDAHPRGVELPGDRKDSDCNGGELCYLDDDGDGYRTSAVVVSEDADCSDAKEAHADTPVGDCDDGDPEVHPGAPDRGGDRVDSDCDGAASCGCRTPSPGLRAPWFCLVGVSVLARARRRLGSPRALAGLDAEDRREARPPGPSPTVVLWTLLLGLALLRRRIPAPT
jgi:hypothetical protein